MKIYWLNSLSLQDLTFRLGIRASTTISIYFTHHRGSYIKFVNNNVYSNPMSKPLQHQPNGFFRLQWCFNKHDSSKILSSNFFTKYINVPYIVPCHYIFSFIFKLVWQTTLSMKSQCLECVGSFHQILHDLVS